MSELINKLKLFNIPLDVKHDHSPEEMIKMRQGIGMIASLLGGEHQACVDHVLLYAELNIRFFFLAHMVDKALLKVAVDKFIENINNLFNKESK